MNVLENIQKQLSVLLQDLQEAASLKPGQLFVIGCSTSEVIGEKIGTAGTEDVAKIIFDTLHDFSQKAGVELVFQCCEHLNRALVIERKVAEAKGYEEVSVIPVRTAGGAMATYAYHHFKDPVMIEFVSADSGMDIGDTFIGMHLKHVAVPVRSTVNNIGQAHVTMAKTRPKLIGGARAIYEITAENESCT